MSQSYVSFYNLSGETVTVNNSVSPSLSSDYWAPPSAQALSGYTPTPTLMFSRDTGITDGDTWNFVSACEVDGVAVQFEVQLTGTATGSDMQQSITAGGFSSGWWSSNETMSVQFTGQSGAVYTVEVALIVRFPLLTYADFIITIAKNILMPNQQLNLGDQLNSANGLMTMTLQKSGLVITRSMFNAETWASPNPGSLTAATAIMQADGNFVVYDSSNNVVWQSGTSGANNFLLFDDTGCMTILNIGSIVPLAIFGPEQDWTAPTFQYTQNGYSFDETSEYWKQMCQNLPCSTVIKWPDYETAIFEATLNGQPAVIQVWRGYCEQILGSSLPGGIGAEVGVYTRQPAIALPGVSSDSGDAPDGDFWWPAPQLVDSISFSLVNLDNNGSVFFESSAENTYWNCKWMSPDSYAAYQQTVPTPPDSDRYEMNFTVNGQTFNWPGQL